MTSGTVKWFDEKKRYGFITGDDGVDVFVHRSGLSMNEIQGLQSGQRVSYETEQTDKGLKAVCVTIQ